MEIAKSDVYNAMHNLQQNAKIGLHQTFRLGEQPDSAYHIRMFLGYGDLSVIGKYRAEILEEMLGSIRRVPLKILIDPKLPRNFDDICNEDRPKSHHRWWYRPFIETTSWEDRRCSNETQREIWFKEWPDGVMYQVRCLDGGAWDRSCWHGSYTTLAEAMTAARALAEEYEPYRLYCRLLYPASLSGGYQYQARSYFIDGEIHTLK